MKTVSYTHLDVYKRQYMYSPETKEWSSVATPYDAEGNEISLGGGMGTSFGEGMILLSLIHI